MKWCGLATSVRMSALGLNCGKRRAYSEPARLRDQFTGRKRPKDSDRPQPGNQNKTQNIAMKTPKITARASVPFWENHNLPYEDRDIINNLFNYTEMLEKSG
jgi:hypothetical protein